MIGGTKRAELDRSAALFNLIMRTKGAYFALMFLVDSGYGIDEVRAIAERLKSAKD